MRIPLTVLLASVLFGCISNVNEVPRADDPVPARTPNPIAVPAEALELDDEEIHDRVHTALENEPSLDAEEITVRVEDGEVYLAGEVASAQQLQVARSLAQSVAGVRRVHVDELEVR